MAHGPKHYPVSMFASAGVKVARGNGSQERRRRRGTDFGFTGAVRVGIWVGIASLVMLFTVSPRLHVPRFATTGAYRMPRGLAKHRRFS